MSGALGYFLTKDLKVGWSVGMERVGRGARPAPASARQPCRGPRRSPLPLTPTTQAFFTELYVENARGDYAIYKLSDLEGSIVLGGANRVVAAEDRRKGIVFGNNYPVAPFYQVGSTCSSASTSAGSLGHLLRPLREDLCSCLSAWIPLPSLRP